VEFYPERNRRHARRVPQRGEPDAPLALREAALSNISTGRPSQNSFAPQDAECDLGVLSHSQVARLSRCNV
jgi:hypothetical protein